MHGNIVLQIFPVLSQEKNDTTCRIYVNAGKKYYFETGYTVVKKSFFYI